ncbi:MAG TPA: DUF2163 domain-containing protein [Sedimentisphaerales bacterium]|nr:DUF2163 domain-containing protein [Sedimentisphaerales bacterium]
MVLRDVSQSLSLSIEHETIAVAELYDVVLRDGTQLYFTSHHVDIDWNGITYVHLPITRDPIQTGVNLEIDSCKVYLAGISGDLVEYIQQNNLDYLKVTIKRIVRGASYASDNEWIVFRGYADVEFNRSILILDLKVWIDSLNIMVPRCVYQETCVWSVFDEFCGMDRADYAVTGGATGGTRMMVSDTAWSATPVAPRYGSGEMVITSGDNAGQRRPIVSHDGNSFGLMWPLPASIDPGDSYTVYPGCDGRAVLTCDSWYSNTDHFRGYVYIPRVEEAMM